MKVSFKKINPQAKTPTKAHESDAGFDFYATSRHYDDNGCLVYGTGIAMDIPDGYVGLAFPRSSISKYGLTLTNCVGVIDAHYRGEITAKFKPTVNFDKLDGIGFERSMYQVGDRIFQLVIIPIPQVELIESDTLSDTDRGVGGYGSTGA